MKAGILYFPGTNCEQDLKVVLENDYNISVELLWHRDSFQPELDIYFVPGGFSYGDYLRSGAMAAISKCVSSLKEAARKDRMIVGICNGFQVLTESHLLPGALLKNAGLKHICHWVELAAMNEFKEIQNFSLPISHSDGNYLCSDEILQKLEDNNQVLFKYINNPNGSRADIAGICSENRRVIGLMPHPERAIHARIDSADTQQGSGRKFFDTLIKMI